MPKSGYGARKLFKRGFTYKKKSSGYKAKSSSSYSFKPYRKKAKPTFKPNRFYRKQAYGYPITKKGLIYRNPSSIKDQDVGNYTYLYNGALTQSAQDKSRIDCLGGIAADLLAFSSAMGRYAVEMGGVPTIGRAKILSEHLEINFAVGPNDLVAPASKMDNAAMVDVFVFKARRNRNIPSGAWGSDWRTVFTTMYTEQTDSLVADMDSPDFSPFENSIWCSYFKCVRRESFILNAQHPTHTLHFTHRVPWVYDQAILPNTSYIGVAEHTEVLVIRTKGQLGLCDGFTNGANRGIAMYAAAPKVGYMAKRTFTYLPTEFLQHENYVLDATSKPTGSDAVIVPEVATEVAKAN